MDLSITIPIYNEESNLPLLYERTTKVAKELGLDYEIILVNDGSSDRSFEIIKALADKDPRLKYVNLSRNFGHQIAISAGLDHCKGKSVVIMDGDLQDPPEMIPKLLEEHKNGFKVVYAQRKKRKGVGILKRAAYKVFYRILSSITHVNIPLDTGDFRVIDQEVVRELREMNEQDKFLRGQIAWMGFSSKAVEYDRDKRHAGEPGYSFSKLVKLALDGIISFSTFPLKMATFLGFLASIGAFIWMLWILYTGLFHPEEEIQGWYSTMVAVLFLGGVQLISIGVIGEYISRINQNVKSRPLYLVEESNTDKVRS